MTTTEVAYARIPTELKTAVAAHADQHGVSQTAAIVALLERGLQADALADRVRAAEEQLAAAQTHGRDAVARVRTLEEREQTLRQTYDGLVARLERPVAKCPKCAADVRGYDLLATGQCQSCKTPLTSLLLSKSAKSTTDQTELLLLLGALGLVLTLAYVQTKAR
jgi:hypothetical protein